MYLGTDLVVENMGTDLGVDLGMALGTALGTEKLGTAWSQV